MTDDKIVISVTGPYTGPLASIAEGNFSNGIGLWADEVNAAGGINGRQIELVKVDNQNTPDGAVSACKEITENGSFMVLVNLSAGSDQCFEDAKIPAVNLGPRFIEADWKYVVGIGLIQAGAPTEVSFLKSSYVNGASKKIGIIFDRDSIGQVNEKDAVTAELEKQGMNLAHTEEVAGGQASYVSELTRMKDAGAEVVLLYAGLGGIGIARDAKSIGYAPQFVAGVSTAIDLAAVAAQGGFEGMLGMRLLTTTETDAYKEWIAKVTEMRGEEEAAKASTLDTQAYGMADIAGTILEAAGKNLTRQGFMDAAKTVKDYSIGIFGPFTFDGRTGFPIGVTAMFPLRCCKADFTFEALGPPVEEFK